MSLSTRKYWATVLYEAYRLAMFGGGAVAMGWMYVHALNDNTRTMNVVFGLGLLFGFIKCLYRLIHIFRKSEKGTSSFVYLLNQEGLKEKNERSTYKEPAKVEGKLKAILAWAFPVMFGIPAIVMLFLLPMIVTSHEPSRTHPWLDFSILMMIPAAILTGIGFLLYRCKRKAKISGMSLTDSLYE